MKPVALLVEHNALLARLLRSVLSRAGCQVVNAANVREARLQLEARRPELLVVDHELADGDGLDVMQTLWRIHQNGKPVSPPVILMTTPNGHEPDPGRLEAMRAHGSRVHHILKPLNIASTEALVRACLATQSDEAHHAGRWRTAQSSGLESSMVGATDVQLSTEAPQFQASTPPRARAVEPLDGDPALRRPGSHSDGDLWIDGDWGVQR